MWCTCICKSVCTFMNVYSVAVCTCICEGVCICVHTHTHTQEIKETARNIPTIVPRAHPHPAGEQGPPVP